MNKERLELLTVLLSKYSEEYINADNYTQMKEVFLAIGCIKIDIDMRSAQL